MCPVLFSFFVLILYIEDVAKPTCSILWNLFWVDDLLLALSFISFLIVGNQYGCLNMEFIEKYQYQSVYVECIFFPLVTITYIKISNCFSSSSCHILFRASPMYHSLSKPLTFYLCFKFKSSSLSFSGIHVIFSNVCLCFYSSLVLSCSFFKIKQT